MCLFQFLRFYFVSWRILSQNSQAYQKYSIFAVAELVQKYSKTLINDSLCRVGWWEEEEWAGVVKHRNIMASSDLGGLGTLWLCKREGRVYDYAHHGCELGIKKKGYIGFDCGLGTYTNDDRRNQRTRVHNTFLWIKSEWCGVSDDMDHIGYEYQGRWPGLWGVWNTYCYASVITWTETGRKKVSFYKNSIPLVIQLVFCSLSSFAFLFFPYL